MYLGLYLEEEKAARAHDKAALKIYKDKAELNYPVVDYIHDIERLGYDRYIYVHTYTRTHTHTDIKGERKMDGCE